jgi:hypothetical protein
MLHSSLRGLDQYFKTTSGLRLRPCFRRVNEIDLLCVLTSFEATGTRADRLSRLVADLMLRFASVHNQKGPLPPQHAPIIHRICEAIKWPQGPQRNASVGMLTSLRIKEVPQKHYFECCIVTPLTHKHRSEAQ